MHSQNVVGTIKVRAIDFEFQAINRILRSAVLRSGAKSRQAKAKRRREQEEASLTGVAWHSGRDKVCCLEPELPRIA